MFKGQRLKFRETSTEAVSDLGGTMQKLPLLIFPIVAVIFFIYAQELADDVASKKLLEWGFDSPTPEYLRDNITAMQGQPFDGIVFRLRKEAHSIFQTTPLTEAELELDLLSELQWGQYTHNFLKLWSTDSSRTFSWFDDAQWDIITSNLKRYVNVVEAAKAEGIAFDVEPYENFGTSPWRFVTKEGQSLYPDKTLVQVESEVRKRGAGRHCKAKKKTSPCCVQFF
jgi:hypothetical protein